MDKIGERLDVVMRVRALESQLLVARALAKGGRVLTVLPTGAGKTLAAGAPFAAGLLPVRQMCFLTPLRTLADQQARVLRQDIRGDEVEQLAGFSWEVREQTGEEPQDPLYEAPAVVCTFDQALSSAFHISYSTSQRRRRINAGAVLSAYLVCDEIHLYPRNAALTSLIWLLRDRPDFPFCLMTATLSEPLARELARVLRAEVVAGLSDADQTTLGINGRRRYIQWLDQPLSAKAILAEAEERKQDALVVVNTVARAISLSRELLATPNPPRVITLHSRFYPKDRSTATEKVLGTLGARQPGDHPLTIVIATQVIEVGIDISAVLLFTELAPANALVQRIGRCARWGGDGWIIIAPPPGDSQIVWPYRSSDEQAVVARTQEWLKNNARHPMLLDSMLEKAFVDAAHGEVDRIWLEGLAAALDSRRTRIGQVSEKGDYAGAGELIRHVEQRTVLIHGDPESIQQPTRMLGFSLPVGALQRVLRSKGAPRTGDDEEEDAWLSLDLPDDVKSWRLKRPVWGESGSESTERRAGHVGGWETVESEQQLVRETLLLLHPSLARYSRTLGLELDPRGVESEYWTRPAKSGGTGLSVPFVGSPRGETFEQHARRMLAVYENTTCLAPWIRALAPAVEPWLGWPPGLLERTVRMAICLHDAAKLADGWASAIRQYQVALGAPVVPWMVHSDPPPQGYPAPRWNPPPHALASAAVSIECGTWLDRASVSGPEVQQGPASAQRILFAAIATHHAPRLDRYLVPRDQLIGPEGMAEVQRVLDAQGLREGPLRVPPPGRPLDDMMVESTLEQRRARREWFAYSLVSRALRLADGWSQEPGRVDALTEAGGPCCG